MPGALISCADCKCDPASLPVPCRGSDDTEWQGPSEGSRGWSCYWITVLQGIHLQLCVREPTLNTWNIKTTRSLFCRCVGCKYWNQLRCKRRNDRQVTNWTMGVAGVTRLFGVNDTRETNPVDSGKHSIWCVRILSDLTCDLNFPTFIDGNQINFT